MKYLYMNIICIFVTLSVSAQKHISTSSEFKYDSFFFDQYIVYDTNKKKNFIREEGKVTLGSVEDLDNPILLNSSFQKAYKDILLLEISTVEIYNTDIPKYEASYQLIQLGDLILMEKDEYSDIYNTIGRDLIDSSDERLHLIISVHKNGKIESIGVQGDDKTTYIYGTVEYIEFNRLKSKRS